MPKALNLIGQRFGRLLVLEKLDQRDVFKKVVWKCKCDCGNFHNINTKSLRSSYVKSCGCLRMEKTTKHGMRNSRTYRIWSQMRTRCEKSKPWIFFTIRRTRNPCMRKMEKFYKFLHWHGRSAEWKNAGSHWQQQRIFKSKLPMGKSKAASDKQVNNSIHNLSKWNPQRFRLGKKNWRSPRYASLPLKNWLANWKSFDYSSKFKNE